MSKCHIVGNHMSQLISQFKMKATWWMLKFFWTVVVCDKSIDKQNRSRSDCFRRRSSLFAFLQLKVQETLLTFKVHLWNEPQHEISNNKVRLNNLWLLSYWWTSFGGCLGSSESVLVKMPQCWKSHVTAQMCPGDTDTLTVAKIKCSHKQTKNDIWAIILEAMGWGFRNLSKTFWC